MINHVRTLLMNDETRYSLRNYGEEYIDPSFRKRALPPQFVRMYRTVFGANPDRLYKNYIMRQLMQLIHATPLEADVYEFDPRVTYIPFNNDLFDAAFTTTIETISGPDMNLVLRGQHYPDRSLGVSTQVWDIAVTGEGEATVQKRRTPMLTTTVSFSVNLPIQLPGSFLELFIPASVPGHRILVTTSARPVMDAGEVCRNMVAGVGNGIDLIFPAGSSEPVKTWEKIWKQHSSEQYRSAAFLLGLANYLDSRPVEAANG